MLFLDTHVALWLYAEPARIPVATQRIIDGEGVIGALTRDLELSIETAGWARAAEIGAHLTWTRDPFDRLITAHALCYNASLCTRDGTIRDHYSHAVWRRL
jgi:PIN domain nuclease of toxin-antitoxin system